MQSSTQKPPKQLKPICESEFPSQQEPTKRSFTKVIFGVFNFYSRLPVTNKIKLIRFQKCLVSHGIGNVKSPQARKSMKTITRVKINDEWIHRISGPQHLYDMMRKLAKSQNYELCLSIYRNTNTKVCRLKEYWEDLYKTLQCIRPKHLCIQTSFSEAYMNRTLIPCLWWEKVLRHLSYMSSLESFCFYVDSSLLSWEKPTVFNEISPCPWIGPKKRFMKLKEIALVHLEEGIPQPIQLYKHFLVSCSLEKVNITTTNKDIENVLVEHLKKTPHLKTLNIQGYFEIEGLLDILETHPELVTIGFIVLWHFTLKPEHLDQLKRCNNRKNIRDVCLDAEIRLATLDQKKLYLGFINEFSNIETLKIDLEWAKSLDLLKSSTDTLVSLKNLTKLVLAMPSTSLYNMTIFFKNMQRLKNLKHFTIVADIAFPKAVAKKLPEMMLAFKLFLQNQQQL